MESLILNLNKPHKKANKGFNFRFDLKIAKEKIKKVIGMLK